MARPGLCLRKGISASVWRVPRGRARQKAGRPGRKMQAGDGQGEGVTRTQSRAMVVGIEQGLYI